MKKIKSVMAGNVWKIIVGVGDEVSVDQDVVILESMKMEIPITSEVKGKVVEIHCKEGDFVDEDQLLLTVE